MWKASDGHYVVRVTLADGKRSGPIHLPAGLTQAQAEKQRAQLVAMGKAGKLHQGDAPPGGMIAFGDWLNLWIADRKRRRIASTSKDHGRLLKWCHGWLTKPMVQISKRDVEELVQRLDAAAALHALAESQGRDLDLGTMTSWKSAMNTWGLVRRAFDDAVRSKTLALRVLKASPADGVRPPDKGTKKAREFVSPSRFDAFVRDHRVPIEWRITVALAVYTGCRASELRGLRWQDVRMADGCIVVHETLDVEGVRGTTKSDETRLVPIEPGLVPLLKKLSAERDERVVRLPDDRHLARGLRRWLETAGLTQGLRRTATHAALTWHDLRATYVTWRLIRGDDPMRVSIAAGHRHFTTTQGYVRRADVLSVHRGAVFPTLDFWHGLSSQGDGEDQEGAEKMRKERVGEVGFEPVEAHGFSEFRPGFGGSDPGTSAHDLTGFATPDESQTKVPEDRIDGLELIRAADALAVELDTWAAMDRWTFGLGKP
jgi:integrase